jgi:hypothetical protein
MKGTKGRAGDVACYRCGRPLTLAQAWKRRRVKHGKPFTEFYCAEHVVITDRGQSWRPLEPGEQPPELTMGDPEPAERTADDVLEGGIPYEAPQSFGEALLREERTPAAYAAPIVEHLNELREQEPDDFNPLDDVGF